ncbi:MAG: DUF1214 domain-containing protein [Deltaproteobacteria bacterium]|nr:DUF1214 domain-containing protein [Deltaproteobacteria bacterium]
MAGSAPPELTAAFDRWLAVQREAVELVQKADHPGTPEDWAEGFRWVTRIASLALDYVVEKGDPLKPVLFHAQDEYRKLLVDNPDVSYWFAVLDPKETYRLTGTRGEAPYLGFTIGTNVFKPSQGGRTGTLGQSYIDQFEVDENGDFEIILSAKRHEGNWIELPEGTQHLAVRETFHDKQKQKHSTMKLERVGGAIVRPLAPAELAQQLDDAGVYLMFVVRTGILMWAGAGQRRNQLTGASGARHVKAQDDQIRSHSDTDMVYMGTRFELAEGEALVIDVAPPPYPFVYWGLVVVNPWMESYDYRHLSVNTNDRQAKKNADGSWTLVLSPEDPSKPNWLDTAGRREGFLLLRWVLAGDAPPTPKCTLVPIASLRG